MKTVQLAKAPLSIDTAQDWYHTSYVIPGFALNAVRAKFELEVRQPSLNDWQRAAQGHACIHADVYLKRSYHPCDVERPPAHLRNKVLPFGLNFACKSWESVRRITSAMLPQAGRQLVRTRTNPGRSWPYIIRDLVDFRRYPTMPRNSLVGVYTRGLHHSTAWRRPEYVAANMCVVGEPVRNVLPRPLEAGVDVLTFTTPGECMESCVRIREDRPLQRMMRARTRAYFEAAIEPGANVINGLERAVAHRSNGALG